MKTHTTPHQSPPPPKKKPTINSPKTPKHTHAHTLHCSPPKKRRKRSAHTTPTNRPPSKKNSRSLPPKTKTHQTIPNPHFCRSGPWDMPLWWSSFWHPPVCPPWRPPSPGRSWTSSLDRPASLEWEARGERSVGELQLFLVFLGGQVGLGGGGAWGCLGEWLVGFVLGLFCLWVIPFKVSPWLMGSKTNHVGHETRTRSWRWLSNILYLWGLACVLLWNVFVFFKRKTT